MSEEKLEILKLSGKIAGVIGGIVDEGKAKEILNEISRIDKKNQTITQLVDADKVAGREHLLHATNLCFFAEKRGKKFADDPRLNLLCWIAGTRQIEVAVREFGVSDATKKVAVVVVGDDSAHVRSTLEFLREKIRIDEVFEVDERKRCLLSRIFSLPEKTDIDVRELVMEKITLLELK